MNIRKALPDDINIIMQIYENAKKFMRLSGNLNQWNNGYPSVDVISEDISQGNLYIAEENDKICAVFAFIEGPDETYRIIYDGSWPNNENYHVIHRIAVSEQGKGISSLIFNECLKKCNVLRIDTHKDNIPMQKALLKNGFSYCGIIHLLNGDERLAYRKERKI